MCDVRGALLWVDELPENGEIVSEETGKHQIFEGCELGNRIKNIVSTMGSCK